MDQEPEVYFIPANVTDNGNVFSGNIKKKNAYEAAAVFTFGLVLSLLLLAFLPFIAKAIIITIFFMISCLALVGIRGQSLFEAILESFFFNKKKRVMKYRLPRKDTEPKEKRKLRKERNKN